MNLVNLLSKYGSNVCYIESIGFGLIGFTLNVFQAIKVNLGHFDLFCSNLFHIQDHLQRDPARVLQAEGAEEAEQGLGLGVGVGGPLPRPRGEAPQELLPQVGFGGRAPNDGFGKFP